MTWHYVFSQTAHLACRISKVGVERFAHRGGEVTVARAAGAQVQPAQSVGAIGVGDEAGEPPRPS